MDYKLFTEFITLQALLKEVGIIQSGGAIKAFLTDNTVLFNGEDEKRRGKKIRIGDVITLPAQEITINLIEPSDYERKEYELEVAEKKRVAELVKKMNQAAKQQAKKNQPKGQGKSKPKSRKQGQTQTYRKKVDKTVKSSKPIRFPGID